MNTIINNINMSVQNIFDELCTLESLAVLLKRYCLSNTYDILSLSDKQKQILSFEKNNCINITDLAITSVEKLKNTSENLERNLSSLYQYTNDSCR